MDLIILDNSGYVYTVSEELLQRRDVVLTGGNQSTFAEKSGGVWPGVNWKHSSHMRLRRNYNLTTGYCRNKSPGNRKERHKHNTNNLTKDIEKCSIVLHR